MTRPSHTSSNYYDLLGVAPECTFEELRAAYRSAARRSHPDISRDIATSAAMTLINEAWRTLSDQESRKRYDETLATIKALPLVARSPSSDPTTGPTDTPTTNSGTTDSIADSTKGAKRQIWTAGVQAQVARLARQAGRSATQTLLIRRPRADRAAYEAVLDELVTLISADILARVRAARASGAAPLDLGVVTTLHGIRIVSDEIRRAAQFNATLQQVMAAEMLDRMWDVVAHEIPLELARAIGGNPNAAERLGQIRQREADR